MGNENFSNLWILAYYQAWFKREDLVPVDFELTKKNQFILFIFIFHEESVALNNQKSEAVILLFT